MTKCITDGCSLPSKARGLCVNCYQAARNAVTNGRVTWEILEEKGLAIHVKRNVAGFGAFEKAMIFKLGVTNDPN